MKFKRNDKFNFHRRHLIIFLCFWTIGLLIGIFLSYSFDYTSAFPVNEFLSQEHSLFVSCLTVFIPICLVFFILKKGNFYLCLPLILIDAISRGFTGFLLFSIIGSGAWLFRILFLFSGNCIAVFLWFIFFDRFYSLTTGKIRFSHIFLFTVIIMFFNQFIISDFLVHLEEGFYFSCLI